MILQASQRGGGRALSSHLLRTDENDHAEVHSLRGFVADDLRGAFDEIYAISRGTRCVQPYFSLSLNPPPDAQVPVEAFERAINDVEARLGLTEQPRAVVFHSKEGRLHAHAVWSRINADTMTAVPLPHFKLKLRDISKQLYLDLDLQMPRGFIDSQARDPANFTLQEYQQAKRAGLNPRALKMMFAELWAATDSRQAFAAALEERGFFLARGDRPQPVAVDHRGQVYAIARQTGLNAKRVRARLGNPEDLPSITETKARIAERMTAAMRRHIRETDEEVKNRRAPLEAKKRELIGRQRAERRYVEDRQATRTIAESRDRANRLRRGIRGLWDRITGQHRKTLLQNQHEFEECVKRDHQEKQALTDRQLIERKELQQEATALQAELRLDSIPLLRDLATYGRWRDATRRGRDDAEAARTEDRTVIKPERRRRGQTPEL